MRHRRCLYTSWFQSSSCCWPGVVLPSLWGQCWCQGLHPPPQTPTWGTVWSTRAITTSPTHPPTTTTTSPERSTGGAGRQGTHIVRSPNPLIKIISHSSKKEKKKDFISITTFFFVSSFFFLDLNIVVSMDSFKNLSKTSTKRWKPTINEFMHKFVQIFLQRTVYLIQ